MGDCLTLIEGVARIPTFGGGSTIKRALSFVCSLVFLLLKSSLSSSVREPVKPGLWTLDWTLDCNMDWSLNLYELAQCGQVAEIVIKEAIGTDLEVEIHSEYPTSLLAIWLD